MYHICKLGLHEQFLKEELKTPVLSTLGLWMNVEVSSKTLLSTNPLKNERLFPAKPNPPPGKNTATTQTPSLEELCEGCCSKM